MNRKWAATESDSEDEVEEQEQQPQPVVEQSEPREVSHKLDHVSDSATDGLMMNIKYSATEGQIRQFLEGANCKIRSIEMIQIEQKFAGRAIVRFEDNASLKIFLGLHGSKLSDMEIVTKVYEEQPRKGSKFSKDKKFLSKSTSRDSRDYRDSKPQDARRRDDRFVEKDDKFQNRRPVRPTKSNDEKDPISKSVSNGDDEGDTTPKERKRVQLAPRTLPVEDIGKPISKTADIFGGGKPHDEFAYEEKKKQTTSTQPETEADKAAPEELKVAQLNIEDNQPAPPAEKAEAVAPPAAPSADEEADKDGRGPRKSGGKFRGQKSGGGKFENFNNDKRPNRPSKSVSKSRDEDKADNHEAPEGAESAEQSNKPEEDGHRDGKAGSRFKKQHSGDKKPSSNKKPAGKREEKEKAEPEPVKEADGFETIKSKSAPKALQPVKQVAAPVKTTPKGSAPAAKNAFSGLVSDSD